MSNNYVELAKSRYPEHEVHALAGVEGGPYALVFPPPAGRTSESNGPLPGHVWLTPDRETAEKLRKGAAEIVELRFDG